MHILRQRHSGTADSLSDKMKFFPRKQPRDGVQQQDSTKTRYEYNEANVRKWFDSYNDMISIRFEKELGYLTKLGAEEEAQFKEQLKQMRRYQKEAWKGRYYPELAKEYIKIGIQKMLYPLNESTKFVWASVSIATSRTLIRTILKLAEENGDTLHSNPNKLSNTTLQHCDLPRLIQLTGFSEDDTRLAMGFAAQELFKYVRDNPVVMESANGNYVRFSLENGTLSASVIGKASEREKISGYE